MTRRIIPKHHRLTAPQYALLQAMLNGARLELLTHKQARTGGYYLCRSGTKTRVNDHTVYALRDRGYFDKKDYYATNLSALHPVMCYREQLAQEPTAEPKVIFGAVNTKTTYKRILELTS